MIQRELGFQMPILYNACHIEIIFIVQGQFLFFMFLTYCTSELYIFVSMVIFITVLEIRDIIRTKSIYLILLVKIEERSVLGG